MQEEISALGTIALDLATEGTEPGLGEAPRGHPDGYLARDCADSDGIGAVRTQIDVSGHGADRDTAGCAKEAYPAGHGVGLRRTGGVSLDVAGLGVEAAMTGATANLQVAGDGAGVEGGGTVDRDVTGGGGDGGVAELTLEAYVAGDRANGNGRAGWTAHLQVLGAAASGENLESRAAFVHAFTCTAGRSANEPAEES